MSPMDLGLKDQVYVVTGASAGLGFATAQVLVEEGARVVVCSRSAERVDAVRRAVDAAFVRAGFAAPGHLDGTPSAPAGLLRSS